MIEKNNNNKFYVHINSQAEDDTQKFERDNLCSISLLHAFLEAFQLLPLHTLFLCSLIISLKITSRR